MQTDIISATQSDYARLVEIWERSVRATHTFLGEDDISRIRKALPEHYLPCVDLHMITVDDTPAGFIGLSTDCIEMLFIDDNYCRLGLGSQLVRFALDRGITRVDVNEQNPQALAFYEAMGFHIVSRDDTDSDGHPFPILHLTL